MRTPSIKGLAMRPAVRALVKLRSDGRLSDPKLCGALAAEEIALLDRGVQPTIWYPIEIQDRFLLLVQELEGAGGDGYLVDWGQRTAAEVLGARSLQIVLAGAQSFGIRAGVALVKMANLGFNFGEWTYAGDSLEDFTVTAIGAGALPDTVCENIVGFIQHVASAHIRAPVRAAFERSSADQVVFSGMRIESQA